MSTKNWRLTVLMSAIILLLLISSVAYAGPAVKKAPAKAVSVWEPLFDVESEPDAGAATWSSLTNMPSSSLSYSSAAGLQGLFYVNGVYYSSSYQNRGYIYSPTPNSWSTMNTTPAVPPYWIFQASAGLGSYLYTSGGLASLTGTYPATAAMHIYNPATSSWSTGSSMPQVRMAHTLVADQAANKLYSVGGAPDYMSAYLGYYDKKFFIYSGGSWSTGPDMQMNRGHSAAGVINGDLYVWGGHTGTATGERYQPATNSWSYVTPNPSSAVHAKAFGVAGTKMHMIDASSSAYLIWDVSTGWTSGPVFPTSCFIGDCSGAVVGDYFYVQKDQYLYRIEVETCGLNVDFQAIPTWVCDEGDIQFVDNSTCTSCTIDSYLWDFGDGGAATTQNPVYHFDEYGNYTVSLQVTSSCGTKTKTISNYIDVFEPVTASFTESVTQACPGWAIDFTNTSTGDFTDSEWAFGDGGSSTLESPTHSYAAAGTFGVSLTVSGECNEDTETKNGLITVYEEPAPDFMWSESDICPNDQVEFTNQSDGLIETYLWTFGDGNTSSETNPAHVYATVGIYDVSLTGTGMCGAETETKEEIITVHPAPNAVFSAADVTVCQGQPVTFLNFSTDATSWLWDFGDTQTSSEVAPNHVYDDMGAFTVALTATGQCGVDQDVKENYVNILELPTADFHGDATRICPGTVVHFTSDAAGVFTSYLWDFGDGVTSTEAAPAHVYSNTGQYTVSLLVNGECGEAEEIKESYITVSDTMTADFAADATIGYAPLTVQFTDLTAGPVSSWSWTFGEGEGSSTAENPSHVYSTPGTYTVSLTATGTCATDDETKVDYIVVEEEPADDDTGDDDTADDDTADDDTGDDDTFQDDDLDDDLDDDADNDLTDDDLSSNDASGDDDSGGSSCGC